MKNVKTFVAVFLAANEMLTTSSVNSSTVTSTLLAMSQSLESTTQGRYATLSVVQ